MKAIVIYCSKTGFTKRYAQWIAQELGCDAVPVQKKMELSGYDAVIFGSWLMAGSVRKAAWFKKQMKAVPGKKIVFATGSMPGNADEAIAQIFEKNFSADERQQLKLFCFQGGLNYEKMGTVERFMMRMLCRMLRNKKDASPEDDAMLKLIEKAFDGTDRSAVAPLVKAVRGER